MEIFDFRARGLSLVGIDGRGGLTGFASAGDIIDAVAALGGRARVFFRPDGGAWELSTAAAFEAAPAGADPFRRETPAGVYEIGWLEDR